MRTVLCIGGILTGAWENGLNGRIKVEVLLGSSLLLEPQRFIS